MCDTALSYPAVMSPSDTMFSGIGVVRQYSAMARVYQASRLSRARAGGAQYTVAVTFKVSCWMLKSSNV